MLNRLANLSVHFVLLLTFFLHLPLRDKDSERIRKILQSKMEKEISD